MRAPTAPFRTALLMLAVCLFGLGAAASENQAVPISINEEGHLIIDVTINDSVQTKAVLDTAATHAMIDFIVANRADVPEPTGTTVNVLGLTGAEFFPVVHLDSLSLGSQRQLSVPSALNARPAVAETRNVVPAGSLPGDILDFDFLKGQVTFYDGRPRRSKGLDTTASPMEEIDGLWFARVEINGIKGLALIDTGSSMTFMNSAFAEAAEVVTHEEKTRLLMGATGGGIGVRICSVRKLDVGKRRLSQFDLLVADPPLFTHLGMEKEPVMVLGLDFLSRFRLQMDRSRGRLLLGTKQDARRGFGIRTNVRGSNIPQD